MLLMRRLYSKIPARQFISGKENKTKHKKTLKPRKDNMSSKTGSSYSEYRSWQEFSARNNDQSDQIKLLSYNILAQDLLNEHMQLYLGIDPSFLSWEHRLKKLQSEIHTLKPDILCLQELQYNHIWHFIHAIDAENNFEYIFKKKTGCRTDGCAIIYDRRKFRLLEEYTVEYYQSHLSPLNRENIAVIVKLCTRDAECKTFIVATTHLLYNPKRDDVRLAQIHLLMLELEKYSSSPENSNRLPVLLTGDFNFQPFSIPHEFVSTGSSNENPQPNLSTQPLRHCLQLTSAYGVKDASTFQNKWITVDYIYYSSRKNSNNIKIWSVYNLPSTDLCKIMGKIPNEKLGSDHLCLAITFSIEISKT